MTPGRTHVLLQIVPKVKVLDVVPLRAAAKASREVFSRTLPAETKFAIVVMEKEDALLLQQVTNPSRRTAHPERKW